MVVTSWSQISLTDYIYKNVGNGESRNIRREFQSLYHRARLNRTTRLAVVRQEQRIVVKAYHGLAMDFAKAEGAQFIVKGVRTVSDFEYEQWQADFNRRLGGIETILLYTEPELASVSSSALRELSHFGVDVSPYLPKR